jgi:surface protein
MFSMSDAYKDTNNLTSITLASTTNSWNMRTNAKRGTPTLTGMFENLRYLTTLVLHDNVVLIGSGIDNDMYYHKPNAGSWGIGSSDNLVGNTLSLANRYADDDIGQYWRTTYTWFPGVFVGNFASNPNAWWRYDNGLITVGLTDKTGEAHVSEFEGTYNGVKSSLPWRDLIVDPNTATGEGATPVYTFSSSVNDGVLIPTNLLGWFKDYTELTTFVGDGLNFSEAVTLENVFYNCQKLESVTGIGTSGAPSATNTSLAGMFYNNLLLKTLTDLTTWNTTNVGDYTGMFQNDAKLASLDLSSWDMQKVSSDLSKVSNMLTGCTGLRSMTLDDGVILVSTGFNNTLTSLTDTDGMWLNVNASGDEVWFDTTTNLAKLYDPANPTRAGPTGHQLWTWDDSRLGGRFPSNPNAWWKYTKDPESENFGLLELGADGGASGDKWVYETAAGGYVHDGETWGTLPWRSVILKTDGTFDNTAITDVTSMGHISPVDLSQWFINHTALETFAGAGFDTDNVTSMARMFEGCSSLSSVTGTTSWNTSNVTSLASMFKGCSSLVTLPSFSNFDVSKVTDFSSMFEGASSLTYATGISGWTTTAGTTFKNMFKDARSLLSLDFSNWNMRANERTYGGVLADDYAQDMMFGCGSLQTVVLGAKWGNSTLDNSKEAPDEAAPTRTLTFDKGSYVPSQSALGNREFDFYAPGSTYLTLVFSNDASMGYCAGWWYHGGHYDTMTFYDGAGNVLTLYNADGTALTSWGNIHGAYVTSHDGVLRLIINYNGDQDNLGVMRGTLYSDGPIYELLTSSGDEGTGSTGVQSSGYWTRATDGWLGSWDELMSSYDAYGGSSMAGTYTWSAGSFGGRFASNLKTWWTYDAGELGLHGTGVAADSRVTETANTSFIDESDRVANTEVFPFEFLRLWSTRNYGTQTYIDSIVSDGNIAPENMESWFNGYGLLTSFDGSGIDTSYATRFKNLFANNGEVKSGTTVTHAGLTSVTGISNWDTDSVVTFERCFYGDSGLDTITSLSGWDVEASTSFAHMFYNVDGLTSLDDLQLWSINTAKDVDMQYMFYGTRFTSLDRIAGWDTSKVTSFSYMFATNTALAHAMAIGASGTNWDIDGADLSYLFYNCTSLEDVDFSEWNMKAAGTVYTNMLLIDSDKTCSLVTVRAGDNTILYGTGLTNSLNDRDISDGMWMREDRAWFDSTTKLAKLYQSDSTRYSGTWAYTWQADLPGGRLIKERTVATVDGSTVVTDVDNDYVWWRYLPNEDPTTGGTLAIGTDYEGATPDLTVINAYDELPWLPLVTNGLKITAISFNGGVKIINPKDWFKGYQYVVTFDGSGIDFSGADPSTTYVAADGTTKTATGTLEGFLQDCPNLTTVSGVANWLKPNIVSLKNLFANDGSLSTIDGIRYWTVGNITDMSGLFQGVSQISSLAFLLNWDVSKVEHFDNMFNGATSLGNLDYIRGWNTASATTMSGMFRGDTSLTSVDLTGWDVSSVTDFSYMFYGDSGVTTMDINTWDMTSSTNRAYMFAGLTQLGTITLGEKVVLTSAGFAGTTSNTTGISTRQASQGRWQLRGGLWYDGTDRLAERYAAGLQPSEVSTYDWQGGKPGGHFSSNQNAWWTYDPTTYTLTFGLDEGTTGEANMQVSETRTAQTWVNDTTGTVLKGDTLLNGTSTYVLPWLAVATPSNTRYVVARNNIIVLNPASWFSGYGELLGFTGSAMDASHAKDFNSMFYNCYKLGTLTGVVGWDVSSAENMSYMFYDDNALTDLSGLSGWQTGNVTNFSYMFYHASALTDATAISDWDTSSATSMSICSATIRCSPTWTSRIGICAPVAMA